MSDKLQQAVERLQRIAKGESLEEVYNDSGQYDSFTCRIGLMTVKLEKDRKILADAYLAEHAPKPLEAYLAFANVLCVEDAVLDYDAAVALAKAMHKRGMVIPNE